MKINFIPESYIEMYHKKSIKNHIILIIILLTINIIFFNKALWSMKRIDVINKEIHSLNLKNRGRVLIIIKWIKTMIFL